MLDTLNKGSILKFSEASFLVWSFGRSCFRLRKYMIVLDVPIARLFSLYFYG